MPGLRRPRNPRTTVGGAFAVIAVAALTAGLAQRAPVSLEEYNPPHTRGQGAPAISAPPAAATTAPTGAVPGPVSSAAGQGASAPARSAASPDGASSSPGPGWIEATATPATPAPPTPTPQSCNHLSVSGTCPLGPSH